MKILAITAILSLKTGTFQGVEGSALLELVVPEFRVVDMEMTEALRELGRASVRHADHHQRALEGPTGDLGS